VTLSDISAVSVRKEPLDIGRTQQIDSLKEPINRFPRLHPALIVVAGACAVLFHQIMKSGLSGDVFYQLVAGQWMLAHHAVIRHDVFSYTVRGRPWLAEEWGFEVLLAWTVNHVGAVSYWLVSAGACSAALIAGVVRWRMTGAGWLWTAALSVLAGAGLSTGLAARPQDLSYFFFALLMLLLTLARRRNAWLLAVPPLLLVWANVHGSFLLGLGMLALEVVWSLLPPMKGRLAVSRPLPKGLAGLTLAASFLATFVNPHGPGLIGYAIKVTTSPQLSGAIAEWQSPNFHSYLFLGVIIGPVLVLVGLLAFSDTVFALGDVVLACVLLLATLHAVRFTPYFALAACAVLATWKPVRTETIRPTVLTLPLAGALVVALLAGPHVSPGTTAKGGTLGAPVAATNFLERQSGRVFTTYWWGDYLIYRHIPVFVDGRTDLYFGTDILQTYLNVSNLTVDPDTVFQRWDVRWVMWGRGSPLSVYLSHDPQWKIVDKTGAALVFEHVGAW
jgi:hypothetical protein